jgi:hypothetical protein
MAAGLGYKDFNTGDVLSAADVNGYLMQGVLVFASTAARDAAITSPQEGQFAYTKDTNGLWYYDGAAWVASGATGDIEGVTAGTGISGGGTSGTVTITNSMATAIDAKGDLIAGTGADTFDRLAVGANDTVLTADSSTATGLKWAAGGAPSYTWTTYTPTLTNITKGNGEVTARHLKIGKLVTVFFKFKMGSTSAMGTDPSFTLPYTPATDSIAYLAYIQDSGTATYVGYGNLNESSIFFYNNQVSGTYSTYTSITSSAPMSWTTNDSIQLYATYEEA